MWDNYRDLFTTPATLPDLSSARCKFAVIVWAITLFVGFNIAHFLVFHVRSSPQIRIDAVSWLCAVPFWTSGHHPHHRVDSVPGPQWGVQHAF